MPGGRNRKADASGLLGQAPFVRHLTKGKEGPNPSSPDLNSLVRVASGSGGGVGLRHGPELRVVAAVLEHGAVVVATQSERLVIRQPRAVEAKVVATALVRVGLAHSEMGRQGCKGSASCQSRHWDLWG